MIRKTGRDLLPVCDHDELWNRRGDGSNSERARRAARSAECPHLPVKRLSDDVWLKRLEDVAQLVWLAVEAFEPAGKKKDESERYE